MNHRIKRSIQLYTTTFSSAKLTPDAFRGATRCEEGEKDCQSDFSTESAAMLEIYYEQMSYEILSESESYLFVNFMSDVGGQAGLWLGASILTLGKTGNSDDRLK